MPYNKEIGEKMEQAAKVAYKELERKINDMSEHELDGAYAVIDYFKDNYMAAGYKKLARKIVKEDVEA